tara:strand:- start:2738 stop:3211 length:474 start_codon:yes stop_codon:yes gene_type:complete
MNERITPELEVGIIAIIKSWKHSQGRLSFPTVIKRMNELDMPPFSRQALRKNIKFRAALEDRQNYLRLPSSKRGGSHEMENALQKIAELQEEKKRDKALIHKMKEQFLRWQYNAHRMNLTRAMLEQPLDDDQPVSFSELKNVADELDKPFVISPKKS